MNDKKRISIRILAIALAVTVGVVLGIWQLQPPRADGDSPGYQRMMSNIERWTSQPRPSGSAAIETVRAQIISEIKAMGLTPIIEEEVYMQSEIIDVNIKAVNAKSIDEWWERSGQHIQEMYGVRSAEEWLFSGIGEDGALLLQNIVVKIDAPDTERGVLFVSHYDSVMTSPGASDDIVSVSALLEAMRNLSQSGALKNDVYFLLADGEEMHLLGSSRFVESHPEIKKNDVMVVNLDNRGNRGAMLLLETSPDAYPLIQAIRGAGVKPVGMSWTAAVYAMMSLGRTDFTPFAKEGYRGVNFLALEGVETYHQPTDTYENLNRNTAWHNLQTVTAIADYAAHNDLNALQEVPSAAVYFPFLPGVMVLMNVVVSHVICAAACLLVLILGIMRAKNRSLRISFSCVSMGLLMLLSIMSEMLFPSCGYLFYLPLLIATITCFTRNHPVAYTAAKAASVVSVLLLWVPAVFVVWIGLVQPMLL